MQLHRFPLFALTALLAVVVTGCDRQEAQPAVSIQSMQPSGDNPLVGGDIVTFTATVRAKGLSKPSSVALVVQSEGQVIGMAEPVSIEDGTPRTLQAEARIPPGSSVEVFTPLYARDAKQTSVLDMRRFKVVGKRGHEG